MDNSHLGKRFLAQGLAYLTVLEGVKITEYQRGISTALLLWNPDVHSRMPVCYMVEECLEASLSSAARTELGAHNTASFSKHHRSLGPTSIRPRKITEPGLSELYPHRLELRLSKLCNLIRTKQLRYIAAPTSKAKFAQSLPSWPATYTAPDPD